jgi:cell division protein FtsI (penicillin-binding protein 3)
MPASKLPPPERKLSKIEIANMSFGQGYAICPAVLSLGFNALASNGWFHPGRLLCGMRDGVTGRIRLTDPAEGWPAVSETACSQMNGMLHKVTTDPMGTGKNAACEGFNVSGKTGTGQVPSPRGGYYKENEHCYMVTFAGYGPSENPRYTIVVVLDKPRGGIKYNSGGKAAAPCFRQIFTALMDLDRRRSAGEGSFQAVD